MRMSYISILFFKSNNSVSLPYNESFSYFSQGSSSEDPTDTEAVSSADSAEHEATSSEVNTDTLRHMALAADRYGVSNRAAAAIVNGFQIDIGRISSSDTRFIVDHKKVQRARVLARIREAEKRKDKVCESELSGVYFDGRKDTSYVMIGSHLDESGPSTRRIAQQEEHIAVVAEPGGEYLTHFTPESGKAHVIFKKLHDVVEEFGGDIAVLGADGTAVNTGKNGGIFRLFELFEGRPVHWFICLLHSNELNLRELFTKLDGVSAGPRSFSGPIGKKLSEDLHNKPLVSFSPVPGNLQNLDKQTIDALSTDQQILYKLTAGIIGGGGNWH